VFERARHYIGSREWEFWMSDEPAGISAELADAPRRCLPVLGMAGVLECLDGDREVADGVWFIPAPGHTPGHAIVRIESRDGRAMFLGDAVLHPLNVSRPDWPCLFDVDGAAAGGSRRRLLDRAARDDAIVMASHMGAPGRIEATWDGFRFVRLD
jgi:glyoxylase-like metal-dependent hydrolase (beta-lactamase superfamily II)